MSVWSLDSLPTWAALLSLATHFAAGIVLGVLYFRAVWSNARLVALGGPIGTMVALIIGRFVLLGGLLTLASLEGALPLLVMALGVLAARSLVMRKLREAIS